MARPLDTIARLRSQAVDAARRDLAEALHGEAAAAGAAQAAGAAVAREQAAASRIDASDAAAEAFAKWLPRGRLALQAAQDAWARAEAASARARACLGAARAAAEAVEQMLAQQHAEERRLALHREQAELDEIARRRPLP
jgi:flagellar export protein FliJ